jgi:hypothetical protein
MAYADFDNSIVSPVTYAGGADGVARLHTALSSPLTGEGNYCREFRSNTTTGVFGPEGRIRGLWTVKSTFDGGSLFEIDNTKAISVRAWVRVANNVTEMNACGVGARIDLADTSATPYVQGKGYFFHIGSYNSQGGTTNVLRFTYGKNTAAAVVTSDNFNVSPLAVGTVVANTWYKLRMDVIPLLSTQDTVRLYTGTGATGSETWTLHHEQVILSSDPDYIAPGAPGEGRVGFCIGVRDTTNPVWIDRFQAFVTDV